MISFQEIEKAIISQIRKQVTILLPFNYHWDKNHLILKFNASLNGFSEVIGELVGKFSSNEFWFGVFGEFLLKKLVESDILPEEYEELFKKAIERNIKEVLSFLDGEFMSISYNIDSLPSFDELKKEVRNIVMSEDLDGLVQKLAEKLNSIIPKDIPLSRLENLVNKNLKSIINEKRIREFYNAGLLNFINKLDNYFEKHIPILENTYLFEDVIKKLWKFLNSDDFSKIVDKLNVTSTYSEFLKVLSNMDIKIEGLYSSQKINSIPLPILKNLKPDKKFVLNSLYLALFSYEKDKFDSLMKEFTEKYSHYIGIILKVRKFWKTINKARKENFNSFLDILKLFLDEGLNDRIFSEILEKRRKIVVRSKEDLNLLYYLRRKTPRGNYEGYTILMDSILDVNILESFKNSRLIVKIKDPMSILEYLERLLLLVDSGNLSYLELKFDSIPKNFETAFRKITKLLGIEDRAKVNWNKIEEISIKVYPDLLEIIPYLKILKENLINVDSSRLKGDVRDWIVRGNYSSPLSYMVLMGGVSLEAIKEAIAFYLYNAPEDFQEVWEKTIKAILDGITLKKIRESVEIVKKIFNVEFKFPNLDDKFFQNESVKNLLVDLLQGNYIFGMTLLNALTYDSEYTLANLLHEYCRRISGDYVKIEGRITII